MSLYFEADNVEKEKSLSKNGNSQNQKSKNQNNKLGIIKGGALVVGSALVAILASMYFYNEKVSNIAITEKENIVKQLKETIAQKKEQSFIADKTEYPFIGESQIHNFKLKFINVNNNVAKASQVINDSLTEKTNNSNNGIVLGANSNIDNHIDNNNDSQLKGNTKNLKDLVLSAAKETGFQSEAEDLNKSNSDYSSDYQITSKLPTIKKEPITTNESIWSIPANKRNLVPFFTYNAHNYSSDSSKRSIILNGTTVRENSYFGRLKVEKIENNQTIFSIDGVKFAHRALDDYQSY